ncbi:DNA-binding response regulator [Kitasatospora phosalacinea]|uniref:Sensory transduction protein RegX3 n=1 Tax=Kitasatospora phosalacinea TaxID=2065 RepID=A0A9W6Q7P8_9ACTN|nr:response regulator transcription factor [Kitasatospora phosalacinea]GLW70089.1 DNA-binding response regulator [Kitasatospora phosalacinea]
MNRPAAQLLDPPPAPHRGARALRVLLVEGDPRAAAPLLQALARQGYAARSVTTGAAALRDHPTADLVLLDLDLPDLDGLEVCRGIRAVSDTPIITVTARSSELDRVLGLQAGSDDYLVKPYGFRELLARMDAVLRRTHPHPSPRSVLTHGPLRIDPGARLTTLHGTRIDLTRKEFDLLHLLATHPGTVLPRPQIMARVWSDTWSPRGRTVDTHVSTLRAKLGPTWIITIRGIGFRLGHPAP